jgi:phage-related protein
MPATQVQYYTTENRRIPVKEFIDSLSQKQRRKVFHILRAIEEYGLLSVIPHLKRLIGTPLWEIRILGQYSIRILYVTPLQNSVLLLHSFVKKTQKTPMKEMNIALARLKDWQESQLN